MPAKRPPPHVPDDYDQWAEREVQRRGGRDLDSTIRQLKFTATTMSGDPADRETAKGRLLALLKAITPTRT